MKAEPPVKPRARIVARECAGLDDLAALDRLRREVFEADADRFQKGKLVPSDLVAAFGYWIGYPFFLEWIGHDWHTNPKRTAAYYALNLTHTLATRVLMEEAERHKLDPHPLYECARVVQEIYADDPGTYYVGPYDVWPECMGRNRYTLPAGQQDALRAGEAVFIRLAVKAGIAEKEDLGEIQRKVRPPEGPPMQADWSKPASKSQVARHCKMSVESLNAHLKANPHRVKKVSRQLWQFDKSDPLFVNLP